MGDIAWDIRMKEDEDFKKLLAEEEAKIHQQLIIKWKRMAEERRQRYEMRRLSKGNLRH
jgi:hypothetical protein